MNTLMVAAFAIAASAAVAAANATKTLTLPGGATTAYSWGNALNGDKANCNGNFPCGTAVKGPCNEQQLDPATGEARLLFRGLSP